MTETWDIKFFGGIAENDFLTRDGEFVESANVEIFDDYSGVGLSNLPAEYLDIYADDTNAGDVAGYVSFDNDLYIFTEEGGANSNGKTYKNAVAQWPGGDASSTGGDTLNAIKFGNDKIILLKVSNLDEYDISTDTCSSLSLSFSTNLAHRPAVVFGSSLYFGNGNLVHELDASLTSLTTALTLEEEALIYVITAYQNFIKIYARQGNGTVQYLWDGISDFPQYVTKIPGLFIRNGVQVGGVDYIYDNEGKIYAFSGTNYQVLKNYQGSRNLKFDDGRWRRIVSVADEIYFTGENNLVDDGVYRQATNRVNGGTSIAKIAWEDSQNSTVIFDAADTIGSFVDGFGGANLFAQDEGGWTNTIYRFSVDPATDKAPTGLLTTKKYWYENTVYKKKLKQIRLSGEVENGAELELYARTDYNTSRTQIGTFDTTGTKTLYANNLENDLGDFDLIQFQLRWVRGDETNGNVVLRNFVVFYDFIQT